MMAGLHLDVSVPVHGYHCKRLLGHRHGAEPSLTLLDAPGRAGQLTFAGSISCVYWTRY